MCRDDQLSTFFRDITMHIRLYGLLRHQSGSCSGRLSRARSRSLSRARSRSLCQVSTEISRCHHLEPNGQQCDGFVIESH
jgi:hypothetical protein